MTSTAASHGRPTPARQHHMSVDFIIVNTIICINIYNYIFSMQIDKQLSATLIGGLPAVHLLCTL